MSRYVYPTIFTPEAEGGYSIHFPDSQSCYTCDDTLTDVTYIAEDVLVFTFSGFEQENTMSPVPSEHLTALAGSFANWILGNTVWYRKRKECQKRKETKENAQKS